MGGRYSTALWELARRHRKRFTRFGIVGASGVVVQMTVLYVLVEAVGLFHLFAAALAVEVSVLTNFMLNDFWTFGAGSNSPWIQRAAKYNGVALTGMVITLSVFTLLTDALRLHYLIANFLAIGTATLSNYALNLRFTWSAPHVVPVEADLLEDNLLA